VTKKIKQHKITEMTPSEIRDGINVLRSRIQMTELALRTEHERSTRSHMHAELSKQAKIISEAKAKIQIIMQRHREAPANIVRFEQQQRLAQRELAALENAALLRRLENVTTELNELMKETQS